MAENFYTILTSTGKAKLANSAVLGSKVNFKTLKVGDGKGSYYEPSENQTSLVNQVWSGNIGSISVDENNPNWIVIETLIPATIGGFFIREAGIFDEDDDLIAISKLSETYKPVVSEGSIKDLCIKVILEVSNVESVTLKIDPTVIVATKKDILVIEAEIKDVNARLSDLTKNKASDTDNARTTTNKTVTGAINELNSSKAKDSDSIRTTKDKTVTGAINELNSNKANKDGVLQTNLNADMVDGLHSDKLGKLYINQNEKDISDAFSKEFYATNVVSNTNAPDASWWHIANLPHCNADGYGSQIALPYGNSPNQNFYFRASLGEKWLGWKKISTTETATITQFYNGWSRWPDDNYGTDLTKSGNLVNLSILVISSSPNQNAMFYLPEGYRPRNNIIGTAWGGNKHSEFRVYKDGTVAMNSTPTAQTWHAMQVTFSV